MLASFSSTFIRIIITMYTVTKSPGIPRLSVVAHYFYRNFPALHQTWSDLFTEAGNWSAGHYDKSAHHQNNAPIELYVNKNEHVVWYSTSRGSLLFATFTNVLDKTNSL